MAISKALVSTLPTNFTSGKIEALSRSLTRQPKPWREEESTRNYGIVGGWSLSALSQVARDAGQEVRSDQSAKGNVAAWSSSISSGVEGDVGGGCGACKEGLWPPGHWFPASSKRLQVGKSGGSRQAGKVRTEDAFST